jgi:cytochrome P450
MSFDFRVISHVLTSSNYQKPWQTRSFLGRLIGRGETTLVSLSVEASERDIPGIFSMEGDEHKFQRRILAPAFTLQAIKNITPVFFRKAEELHDRWKDIIDGAASPVVEASSTATSSASNSGDIIDVAHWISRASFDVIGLAGFDYDFHSLQDETEEVYDAYRRMFNIADQGLGLREILELYFPILRKIWVRFVISGLEINPNPVGCPG